MPPKRVPVSSAAGVRAAPEPRPAEDGASETQSNAASEAESGAESDPEKAAVSEGKAATGATIGGSPLLLLKRSPCCKTNLSYMWFFQDQKKEMDTTNYKLPCSGVFHVRIPVPRHRVP